MPPAFASAASPGNEEAAAAPPLRIPQLTYRNRGDQPPASRSSSMPGRGTAPERSAAAEQDADDAITVVPSKSAPGRTARRQVDWAVEPATPTTSSTPSKSTSDSAAKQKNRKRGSSFFSFLAVKEPTSEALEQYAEIQRKQAEAKGKSFMAGVSSQKLPLAVPKVNTKWDGLPQAATKPDLKRASTVSAGTLYHHARRGSIATTNSSSKVSRRSQRSAESSLVELGRVPPPPPSLENLSIKSHPRHDSGTAGVFDPIIPSPTDTPKPLLNKPLAPIEPRHAAGSPRPNNRHINTNAAASHRHSCHFPPSAPCSSVANHMPFSSSTPKEIAPWAEPADDPLDDDRSAGHSSSASYSSLDQPRNGAVAAAVCIDDMDFITSSPISGAPEKSIEEQIAEAERKTADVAQAGARRMPPASNAQALAKLERPGGAGRGVGAEVKPKSKRGGAASRLMRFAGKG